MKTHFQENKYGWLKIYPMFTNTGKKKKLINGSSSHITQINNANHNIYYINGNISVNKNISNINLSNNYVFSGFYQNVRGLNTKLLNIHLNMPCFNHSDYIVLTETWLTSTT